MTVSNARQIQFISYWCVTEQPISLQQLWSDSCKWLSSICVLCVFHIAHKLNENTDTFTHSFSKVLVLCCYFFFALSLRFGREIKIASQHCLLALIFRLSFSLVPIKIEHLLLASSSFRLVYLFIYFIFAHLVSTRMNVCATSLCVFSLIVYFGFMTAVCFFLFFTSLASIYLSSSPHTVA